MTTEQLGQMMHAQPFRPFRIRLADGRHLDVAHPDFVARSPSGRTVVVYKDDDASEVIDLLLVTSLEATNGERRSRSN